MGGAAGAALNRPCGATMTGLLLDLSHAWRSLLRARTATFGAVLVLALGIGAAATMFEAIDLLFFRPPAGVDRPEALRRLYFSDIEPGFTASASPLTSYPVFSDLRAGWHGASNVAAFFRFAVPLGRGSSTRRITATVVSPSFWPTLGVRPARGRLFTEAEGDFDHPSSVAVLGYDFWRRELGASPTILGHRLWLGRDAYTVIGVLPRGFTGIDLEATDVWLPMNALAGLNAFGGGPGWQRSRGSAFLQVVARLRPEVPAEAAATEAETLVRHAWVAAGTPRPGARITLERAQRARGPRPPLDFRVSGALSGISLLVLLIACGNVINLLLVRGLSRRSEIAMRIALGAQGWQLARLALAEALLLGLLAALGAVGLVALGERLSWAYLLPRGTLSSDRLALRTLGLVAAAALAAVLVCGLLPALAAGRDRQSRGLKAAGPLAALPHSRLRAALLAGQVALTLVLLVGAGLFSGSLVRARGHHLGLDAERLLVATIDFEQAKLTKAQTDGIYQRALGRVLTLPGVEHASLASSAPFVESRALTWAAPGGNEQPAVTTGGPYVNAVTADYWQTLGTPVLRGRGFSDTGREGTVALVNQSMARLVWPGKEVLGQCLKLESDSAPCATVIGVTADTHLLSVREDLTLQYYVPLRQAPETLSAGALLVRARQPGALAATLRRELQALAPGISLVEVQPLTEVLAPQLHPWTLGATMLSLFGGLALVLAIVGIHGVITLTLQQRTAELALRSALGAPWRRVLWLVVRPSLATTAAGILAGLVLVVIGSRWVEPLLFETRALDPATLLLVLALLLATALLASFLPAFRVRGLDPARALRGD